MSTCRCFGEVSETPLSEQGDVKEEGIDLLVMPDD